MMVFRSWINDYVYYLLKSDVFRWQAGAFSTSTINQLTNSELANMAIPLPPREEQQRILSFITKKEKEVERLLNAARESMMFLNERRSALISAAVTGKIDVREWKHSTPSTEESLPRVAEKERRYG